MLITARLMKKWLFKIKRYFNRVVLKTLPAGKNLNDLVWNNFGYFYFNYCSKDFFVVKNILALITSNLVHPTIILLLFTPFGRGDLIYCSALITQWLLTFKARGIWF